MFIVDSQEHMDGPIHVAAAGQGPGQKSLRLSRHFISRFHATQDFVTLIFAFQMSCAVLGSSLTIVVGVKMFFQHQKHADTGELKQDATSRLADAAVRASRRQNRHGCTPNSALLRLIGQGPVGNSLSTLSWLMDSVRTCRQLVSENSELS
jgi:hypothetical protein